MICKTIVFTISGESRKVTCSFSKMLEKLSRFSVNTFITFQISMSSYFSEHLFFSPLHGGWPRYNTSNYQMRARGIIDTFYILEVFKVARIFDKNFGHDDYGVK